jgi:hypothetical protein
VRLPLDLIRVTSGQVFAGGDDRDPLRQVLCHLREKAFAADLAASLSVGISQQAELPGRRITGEFDILDEDRAAGGPSALAKLFFRLAFRSVQRDLDLCGGDCGGRCLPAGNPCHYSIESYSVQNLCRVRYSGVCGLPGLAMGGGPGEQQTCK